MVIGILQFELLIHGAESLKDKRRVVSSVKDRLHREHMVSIAEVGAQEALNVALLGLSCVGTDGKRVADVLDKVTAKLRALTDAELGDCRRELLHGVDPTEDAAPDREDDEGLIGEMLARFDEPDSEPGERP